MNIQINISYFQAKEKGKGSKPAKTILLQLLSIPYTSILPSIYRFNQH